MLGAAERGHMAIGLGDFNMLPLSLAHRIIESRAPVRDIWRVVHPNSSIGAAENPVEQARGFPVPNVEYNLEKNGATCDSAYNTWRWNKGHQKLLDKGQDPGIVDMTSQDVRAKRLDYIFFGSGTGAGARTWMVDEVKVGMTMRHPTLLCSLSDHFSVEAVLSCHAPSLLLESDRDSGRGDQSESSTATAASSARVGSRAIKPETSHLSPNIFTDIQTMIQKYVARERRQRRLRVSHFVGEVTISIGCLIAIWWSPHNYVSFILMLLSTLGLSAGVIDGMIGGLFVSSELRALKEFEWEIENARQAALRDTGRIESWPLSKKVAAERFDVDGQGDSNVFVGR